MKRNLFFVLIMLFILSACQPGPGDQRQATTAAQAATGTFQPTATTASNLFLITSEILENLDPSEYPQNAKNFIVNKETSGEQLEKIWKNENSYYKERMSVYLEAIRLSQQDPNNFKNYVSIYPSDEESIEAWAFVMRDKTNGDLLIPAKSSDGIPYSDLIINPSANQDSFSLIRVSSPDGGKLRIIFDKSKWPIIVTDTYSKWYNLGCAPIGWKDISAEELETIEILDIPDKIEVSTNIENFSSWPEITLEQFPEYVTVLKKYVQDNQIFPDDVLPNFGEYYLNTGAFDYNRVFFSEKNPLISEYRAFPNRIPRKTFAYAFLDWRIPNTRVFRSIIMSQVWLDESNNHFVILNYIDPCEDNKCPDDYFIEDIPGLKSGVYDSHPGFYIDNEASEVKQNIISYKENQIFEVKDLIQKWIEDQEIPLELENKIIIHRR